MAGPGGRTPADWVTPIVEPGALVHLGRRHKTPVACAPRTVSVAARRFLTLHLSVQPVRLVVPFKRHRMMQADEVPTLRFQLLN
jgi:hypothetical protein